jgi:glycosyltransferase involved in cell wall biosynthesis
MRAAIFNPYLDTLGGGERYTMSFAKVLLEKGYAVDVEWKDKTIKEKLESRFGLNLTGLNFVDNINRGDGYDLCFWVSDGSIPALKSRKNILHFQVPFHDVKGKTLLNKMKLFRVNKIVCNSEFTKKVIDKEFGVESMVLYPPVSVETIKPKRKENIILFVGRFSQLKQAKRHDVLIDAFKKLVKDGLTDWKLVLAGGSDVGTGEYLEELKEKAQGYPIEFLTNVPYKEIVSLYGISKIFWSAVGYGINEEKEPEKMEHFGMAVVEAMAAKAVPVVYNAGGHKEVIKDDVNGFLWNSVKKLLKMTSKLITNKSLINKISIKTRQNSEKFGYTIFKDELSKII